MGGEISCRWDRIDAGVDEVFSSRMVQSEREEKEKGFPFHSFSHDGI